MQQCRKNESHREGQLFTEAPDNRTMKNYERVTSHTKLHLRKKERIGTTTQASIKNLVYDNKNAEKVLTT